MFLSVIIPTRHRNDLLGLCLQRLAPGAQSFSFDSYEVIVCDDGTVETAEELVKRQFPWARWVRGPKLGPAANRNCGAREARGEWLVFTDDDCLPGPMWLASFSEEMNGYSQALEGAIHPEGDMNQDLAECPVNLRGGCFWSGNIAVATTLFQEIGGFDPKYRCREEDLDLKLRLEARMKIVFVPAAAVTHPVRLCSVRQSIMRVPGWARDRAYHLFKHGRMPGQRGSIVMFLYKWHISQLWVQLLRRRFKCALDAVMWITVGNFLTLSYLRRLRRLHGEIS